MPEDSHTRVSRTNREAEPDAAKSKSSAHPPGRSQPPMLDAASLLSLQRLVGNQAVLGMLERSPSQPAHESVASTVVMRKPGKGKGKVEEEVEEADSEDGSSVEDRAITAASTGEVYDGHVTALNEAIYEFDDNHGNLGTKKLIAAAKVAIAKVRELEVDVSDYLVVIKSRWDAATKAMDEAADIGGTPYEEAVNEDTDFEALHRKAIIAQPKLDDKVTEREGTVDIADEGEAASKELTRLRNLWGSAAMAKGHFSKHTSDTGLGTEAAYLAAAETLCMTATATANILIKTRSDGDKLFFDKTNGFFAIRAKGGQIRTLFKPGKGKKYYDEQT